MGVFPTPKNFNYFWNFGAIAMFMLITMIVTGITLAMHYAANTGIAFDSVERIMRDVNYGWPSLYSHEWCIVLLYCCLRSYFPRCITDHINNPAKFVDFRCGHFPFDDGNRFMGYVLPWGQMSYWVPRLSPTSLRRFRSWAIRFSNCWPEASRLIINP